MPNTHPIAALRMTTALVTGASGFIGPRLVARLQSAGYDVACLVRRSSNTARLDPLGVRLIVGDVTDPDSLPAALAGVDTVFHLAGKLHAKSLADFLLVNEHGASNLAHACARRETPPTLVLVSSVAAAGPSSPGSANTEDDPPRPISNYGRSKLAGEVAARRFALEAPITIVRPPVVFGPGDRDGLQLFRGLKYTRLHLVPQLKGLPLSLIHADDLADAIARAAEQGERAAPHTRESPAHGSGLYYAADPRATSWAEAGRMAAAALGVRVLVVRRRKYPFIVPALVGDAVGRLTGKPTLFGMDKLREASASGWVCSNDKAEQQLGFRPAKPLEERYRETVDWYREHGWL